MNIREQIKTSETLDAAIMRSLSLGEAIHGHARGEFVHMRPKDWVKNPRTGLLEPDYRYKDSPVGRVIDEDSVEVLGRDEVWNLITNPGRIYIHKQSYDTTGLGANGLNYIALSNDALTETAVSTVLSNEITLNGLGRAQGTVTIPTGAGTQTTIAKTFTASGGQAAQKAALFTASSAGTMNHVLAFTQRTLITGDTLAVTFTITLT